MNEYLFSYGTLQVGTIQATLFGRLLKGSADVLKGYSLSSIEIRDEFVLSEDGQACYPIAIISNDKNDFIEGTVFEMSPQELLLADQYETAAYKRVRVQLESGKKAWVYAAAK